MGGLWCYSGQIDQVKKPPIVKMHIYPAGAGLPAITAGAGKDFPIRQHHLPSLMIPAIQNFAAPRKCKLDVYGVVYNLARNGPKTAREVF